MDNRMIYADKSDRLATVMFIIMIMIYITSTVLIYSSHGFGFKKPKIVGLVAARNEAPMIKNCLKALALYTDAIVYLDDVSTDNTLAVVQSLAAECHVEKIIAKTVWNRNERADKQALLVEGRKIGGTHFIMLDVDEIILAPCAQNQWLRNIILGLRPGQYIELPFIHAWGSCQQYRNDDLCNPHCWNIRKFTGLQAVFCDDGTCTFVNLFFPAYPPMHVNRIPPNLSCASKVRFSDINRGIMHLKYVDLEETKNKKFWYMCLEYIKRNEQSGDDQSNRIRNAAIINKNYEKEFFDTPFDHLELIKTEAIPSDWLAGYDFFDHQCYYLTISTRKQDIVSWLNKYGPDYFKNLDIWHDWLSPFKNHLDKAKENLDATTSVS